MTKSRQSNPSRFQKGQKKGAPKVTPAMKHKSKMERRARINKNKTAFPGCTAKRVSRTSQAQAAKVPLEIPILTLQELAMVTGDDDTLRGFLQKWGLIDQLLACTRCGGPVGIRKRAELKDIWWRCTVCYTYYSIRSDTSTIRHFPKIPSAQLLECLYLIAMDIPYKKCAEMTGVSCRSIGIVQDMVQMAMQQHLAQVRRKVDGIVEVDECMWGANQKGLHGRKARPRGALWGAWERHTGMFIIEHMKWLPNMHQMRGAAPAEEVIPRVTRWVEPNSTVFTDGLRAYLQLKKHGYDHDYVKHCEGQWVKQRGDVKCHTQSIDGLWGRLKAWLRGKHGVHREKRPGYVAEYEWRHRQRLQNKFDALLDTLQKADWLQYDQETRAGVGGPQPEEEGQGEEDCGLLSSGEEEG